MPHKMEMSAAGRRIRAVRDPGQTAFPLQRLFVSGHAAFTIPIALEGALKLKEISYIHAEGYPAGEMKHGPNALIDENLPVVVLATQDESDPDSVTRYEKSVSNIQEVKARDGIVISIATEGDQLARAGFRLHHRVAAGAGIVGATAGDYPFTVVGVSHRHSARMRRGPTEKPGEVGHRRVIAQDRGTCREFPLE